MEIKEGKWVVVTKEVNQNGAKVNHFVRLKKIDTNDSDIPYLIEDELRLYDYMHSSSWCRDVRLATRKECEIHEVSNEYSNAWYEKDGNFVFYGKNTIYGFTPDFKVIHPSSIKDYRSAKQSEVEERLIDVVKHHYPKGTKFQSAMGGTAWFTSTGSFNVKVLDCAVFTGGMCVLYKEKFAVRKLEKPIDDKDYMSYVGRFIRLMGRKGDGVAKINRVDVKNEDGQWIHHTPSLSTGGGFKVHHTRGFVEGVDFKILPEYEVSDPNTYGITSYPVRATQDIILKDIGHDKEFFDIVIPKGTITWTSHISPHNLDTINLIEGNRFSINFKKGLFESVSSSDGGVVSSKDFILDKINKLYPPGTVYNALDGRGKVTDKFYTVPLDGKAYYHDSSTIAIKVGLGLVFHDGKFAEKTVSSFKIGDIVQIRRYSSIVYYVGLLDSQFSYYEVSRDSVNDFLKGGDKGKVMHIFREDDVNYLCIEWDREGKHITVSESSVIKSARPELVQEEINDYIEDTEDDVPDNPLKSKLKSKKKKKRRISKISVDVSNKQLLIFKNQKR